MLASFDIMVVYWLLKRPEKQQIQFAIHDAVYTGEIRGFFKRFLIKNILYLEDCLKILCGKHWPNNIVLNIAFIGHTCDDYNVVTALFCNLEP